MTGVIGLNAVKAVGENMWCNLKCCSTWAKLCNHYANIFYTNFN